MENYILKTPKKNEKFVAKEKPKRNKSISLTGSLKKADVKSGLQSSEKSPQISSLEIDRKEALKLLNDIKISGSVKKSLNFQDEKEFPSPQKDEEIANVSGSSDAKENSLVRNFFFMAHQIKIF